MNQQHARKNQLPLAMIFLGIALYSLLFITLTLWKYHHFYYDNLDLAIFNNVFLNTLHGSPFAATIHPPSYLGDHFSPIIFLLIPLYSLFPGPQVLLVVQTLIIAFTALPIYLIASRILGAKKQWIAAGVALLWLVNPLTHNTNFFEFELAPFATFFLFWTMFFYLKGNRIGFLAGLVLALLVREDVALITLFIGVLALVERKSWFWVLAPVVGSALSMRVSFWIISLFNTAGSYKFLIYYNWLGGTTLPTIAASFFLHPIQTVLHLFTIRNLEFLLGLTFPFFFLVITPSRYLWLLAAPLAQIELSAPGGSAIILMTHYASFFMLGLFLVFIARLSRFEQHGFWPRLIPKVFRQKPLLYVVIGGASLYAALTYGSVVPALASWTADNQVNSKKTLIQMIPKNATVAATFELLTPLSTRKKIYALHYAAVGKNQYAQTDYSLPADTAYVAIDWQDMVKTQMHFSTHYSFGRFADQVPRNLRSMLEQFKPVYADGSLLLMEKSPKKEAVPFIAFVDNANSSDIISVAQTKPDMTVLRVSLPSNAEHAYYYLSATTRSRTFTIPLAYGLYDANELRGKSFDMPVYINADEQKNAQIKLFGWNKGFLKLSKLKNLEKESDAKLLQTLELDR